MPSDSVLQRLLEQVEGSHYSFIRFVGRISRHEWDWSPDDGIQSAHDVVVELIREEGRVARKVTGTAGVAMPHESRDLSSPAAAATALRGIREGTLMALRRTLNDADEAAPRNLVQSAISLAQLDAHALGALGVLQRLIDPTRAKVSPR
jgi:hypothetical protein